LRDVCPASSQISPTSSSTHVERDDPDGRAGADETDREDRQARAGQREHDIGAGECGGSADEDLHGATSVAAAARGHADESRREVVSRVERERELRACVGAAPGTQQLGRAQDQQRGRDVAELEGADRAKQPAEVAAQRTRRTWMRIGWRSLMRRSLAALA